MAGQHGQLLDRLVRRFWFGENSILQRQDLVAAEHQGAGMRQRYFSRFHFGQGVGHIAGSGPVRRKAREQGIFVNSGRVDHNRNPCVFQ